MSDWVPTTCMRCAVGCGHTHRGVDLGYGVDIGRGDTAHPTTRGQACSRGIEETVEPGGDWLTRPLVRRDGELVPTTWDVALGEVVTRMRATVAENRDSVGVLGSGQQTIEAAYALGKVARGGIGTRYYDANTTLCMASAVTAYYDAFGSDAPPPTYEDIPVAESHVVWGANPAVAHPVLFRWIHASANGRGESETEDGTLVVVDPVETRSARAADVHVAPDPGTDLALARGVLARALERDTVAHAFVDAHTEGFGTLVETLPDPESAAATAGVSLTDLDTLVDALDDPTLVYWGMGVNQSAQGTDTCGALVDLCLATGNLGEGRGPFSLTGQANSMGTRVCSSKGTWPGHRPFDDPDARRAVAGSWGVQTSRLPAETGPGPVGMLEALDDEIDVLWTVATNPAAGVPDATKVRERLDETFLVAQDAFRSETVEFADVVLPAATWGETDGTAMNMERSVSRVRAASDQPPGVRPDLDIIVEVGNSIEPGLFDATDPSDVFDEFAALTAGSRADCSGITYERLEHEQAVRWPAPDEESHAGYRYVDGDGFSFPTPSGRARFSSGTHRGLPEPTDEEFPLTLTTARTADGYNTGVRTRSEGPDRPIARVHPETLAEEVVHEGRTVLISRRGRVVVGVEPESAVPEGVVWMPIHNAVVNDVTLPAVDPRSAEPNLKQCAVSLMAPTATDLEGESVAPPEVVADGGSR